MQRLLVYRRPRVGLWGHLYIVNLGPYGLPIWHGLSPHNSIMVEPGKLNAVSCPQAVNGLTTLRWDPQIFRSLITSDTLLDVRLLRKEPMTHI